MSTEQITAVFAGIALLFTAYTALKAKQATWAADARLADEAVAQRERIEARETQRLALEQAARIADAHHKENVKTLQAIEGTSKIIEKHTNGINSTLQEKFDALALDFRTLQKVSAEQAARGATGDLRDAQAQVKAEEATVRRPRKED